MRTKFIAAGIALVLVTSLAACSTEAAEPSPPLSTSTTASDAIPEKNDCWVTDPSLNDGREGTKFPLAWSGAAPVDCADDHDVVTLSTVEVPDDLIATFTATTTMGDVTGETRNYIQSTCGKAPADALQVEDASLYRTFSVQPHLPTPEAWAEGTRWLRCDLMKLPPGFNFAAEKATSSYALLPSSVDALAADMLENPRKYQLCAVTSGGQDPFASQGRLTTLADCTQDYEWRLASSVNVTDAFPDGNPGDEAIQAYARGLCESAAGEQEWWAYWPLAKEWSDTASFSCWLKDGPLAR
ncbi:septum formation family protein [Frigoribacterium faeni]|uniref:Septum formation-related domain-containing protein n=1 Tax=Frigoribacterium faeni TaxID=145483 RepID=A0A7W3PJT1_9MICO|nr:septum formation family protein [Frigoribacterium faeni]MBA8814378.1 hypothetical protein [Frigoribacterium faeni]GEK84798.1 hypothetical protein FFA01_31070 [Frigoribacterium faeni]